MKTSISLVFLLCFASCASLTPNGRKVRFTGQVLPECKFLGATDATENVLFMETKLKNVLKNQAAEMGGDWVVLTGPSTGDVYKCPEGSFNSRQADATINLKINTEKK